MAARVSTWRYSSGYHNRTERPPNPRATTRLSDCRTATCEIKTRCPNAGDVSPDLNPIWKANGHVMIQLIDANIGPNRLALLKVPLSSVNFTRINAAIRADSNHRIYSALLVCPAHPYPAIERVQSSPRIALSLHHSSILPNVSLAQALAFGEW